MRTTLGSLKNGIFCAISGFCQFGTSYYNDRSDATAASEPTLPLGAPMTVGEFPSSLVLAPLEELTMPVSLSRLLGFTGSSLGAVAFALPLTSSFAQEEREIVIQRIVLEEKGEKGGKEEQDDDDDDDDEKQPAYWIGVALEGSEGAESLRISAVLPDSPALKAGLKAGDTLVAVGDKKLQELEQLVDLIEDSKGKTLKVKVSRDGKEQVLEVTPGKRPKNLATEEREEREEKERKEEKGEQKESNRYVPQPGQPGTAWRKIEVAPKPGSAPHAGSGTMHLYTLPETGPGSAPPAGSAFPPGASWGPPGGNPGMARMTMALQHAPLPDDMEVAIYKKGNKPAVVTVKQGDKFWKTTENELGMLPPPAQAYAARLLGQDVIRARVPAGGNPGMMPGAPHGKTGVVPMREMRQIELRLTKEGKLEATEGGKNAPQVKVLPGGGIQVEIHEGDEEKEGKKSEGKGEKEDPDRAHRLRALEEQRERLQGLLNKLREDVKARESKEK